MLYIGTQYNPSGPTGWLLAINAANGNLVWKTQPDTSNSFPVITSSPAVADGIVFVGMTSNEEFAAANPSYPCCSVRSSVVALDAYTGAKLWQTFTVPTGYSGAAVWGSNPVVDLDRHTVFIGTGNNYSHPTDPAYLACHCGRRPREGLPFCQRSCGFDCRPRHVTGHVKWATRLMTWNLTSPPYPTAVTTGTSPASFVRPQLSG